MSSQINIVDVFVTAAITVCWLSLVPFTCRLVCGFFMTAAESFFSFSTRARLVGGRSGVAFSIETGLIGALSPLASAWLIRLETSMTYAGVVRHWCNVDDSCAAYRSVHCYREGPPGLILRLVIRCRWTAFVSWTVVRNLWNVCAKLA